MTDQTKIARPRGTRDILPSEQPLWRHVMREAERLCDLYGYRPISTPVFEETTLFERTSGSGSDVVQKEMYTFEDRSGRSLTLRPEATAPICRAYVENGMHRASQPTKLYTVGPFYRYATPQRGRYREFWQLSVEAIGSDDPALDAEVIQLYDTLLDRLGVPGHELELNSIGCRACRPAYLEKLEAWLEANAERLDAETREKAVGNPLRVFDNLDSRPAAIQQVLGEAPAIGEALCDACREHFAAVRLQLDGVGVSYRLVPTLVRGLDYYTRTTWEFVESGRGAQSALSGGGRYDGLVEEIGGPPTPGVGFGAGIERLVLALEEADVSIRPPVIDVFIAADDDAPRERIARWLTELRGRGVSSDADYAGRSLKGQLTQATRLGASTIVVARAGGALIRRAGAPDEEIGLDEVVERVTV
jgi:histidyl-tRNA synthetase